MWQIFRCAACGAVTLEDPTTAVAADRDGALVLRVCGLGRIYGDVGEKYTRNCDGAVEFIGYLATIAPPPATYRLEPWRGPLPPIVER